MPKSPQVVEKLVEVHSRCTEDDVVHVSFRTPEPITVEPMFFFEMPYSGLDCESALHPFPKSSGRAPSSLLVNVDLDAFTFVPVTPVPLIGEDVFRKSGTESFYLFETLGKGVPIIWVARQTHCSDVPAAFASSG